MNDIMTYEELKNIIIGTDWQKEELLEYDYEFFKISFEKISGYSEDYLDELEVQVVIEVANHDEIYLCCFNINKHTIKSDNIIKIQHDILIKNLGIALEMLNNKNLDIIKSIKDNINLMVD